MKKCIRPSSALILSLIGFLFIELSSSSLLAQPAKSGSRASSRAAATAAEGSDSTAGPTAVRIQKQDGQFTLLRGGKQFPIHGVGGSQYLETLVAMGGNSIRTWGVQTAQEDLDNARKNGLTVCLGFWMGHERHGFNYTDSAQVESQSQEFRAVVERFKSHPALLIWGIGNEVELECQHEEVIWKQANALAEIAHRLDPNHPTMVVVAEISEEKIARIERLCPAVDILGINSYGGAESLPVRYKKYGGTKPYILTEFGPHGHWECQKSPFGPPFELTSTEKGNVYAKSYSAAGTPGKNGCLGSYAFVWGNKTEATPTWYGMFLSDGSRLAAPESMHDVWLSGKPLANRAPTIQEITVSETAPLDPSAEISAQCAAQDLDSDALTWTWSLIQEAAQYSTGGDAQAETPDFPEAIVAGQGTPSVKVKLPGGGIYRLYAYARDGRGAAAYANCLLKGQGDPPKARRPKGSIPQTVFQSGKSGPWIPSGYMGTTQAIQMQLDCPTAPHSGSTCIRAQFVDHSGWGGVLWQSPANDWGNQPGGLDLSGANTLEFYARGETGGEVVTFQVGGLEKANFPDSFRTQKREIVLSTTWTRYRIALDGLDLSCVKTPFGWVYASNGQSTVFFLDDIQFINQP